MTIEQAIHKATGNGWNPKIIGIGETPVFYFFTNDPSFWQSLGKVLGWEVEWNGQYLVTRDNPQERWMVAGWIQHWHRFVDHLAQNGSIESFFEEIK